MGKKETKIKENWQHLFRWLKDHGLFELWRQENKKNKTFRWDDGESILNTLILSFNWINTIDGYDFWWFVYQNWVNEAKPRERDRLCWLSTAYSGQIYEQNPRLQKAFPEYKNYYKKQ